VSTSSKANHQGTESESVPPRLAALLLAPLLLLLALPVGAQNWVRYAENEVIDYYFDPSTIRMRSQFLRVWTLSDYKKGDGFHGRSSLVLWELDCTDERVRQIASEGRLERMGKGVSMKRATISPVPDWDYAAPGGPEARLLKQVCAGRK
jgi:hypothetical protein